uniref:CSON012899 protein n=1 Tax=Culicoides sonorensis TaxID=179676 RepID=A0A336MAI6_CULSO
MDHKEVILLTNSIYGCANHCAVQINDKILSYDQDGLRILKKEEYIKEKGGEKKIKRHLIGRSYKTDEEILTFAKKLSTCAFEKYDLITRNCCNFANKVTDFACQKSIPYLYNNQSWIIPLSIFIILFLSMIFIDVFVTYKNKKRHFYDPMINNAYI